MIVCKLTGKSGPAVKSHIVPKAFYELPPQSEGPTRILTNTPGQFPKKSPTGIYDDAIVTSEGESLFGPWDDYACKVLLNRFKEFTPLYESNQLVGWQLEDVDYARLKLFGLSVLWRAHASTDPFFQRVKLGVVHEEKIRDLLLRADPAKAEDYSVCFMRWIDDDFGPVPPMDAIRQRIDGVNFYLVYCGRYVLYVKVDQRDTGPSLREFQVAPTRPLIVCARNFSKSKDRQVMRNIVQSNPSP